MRIRNNNALDLEAADGELIAVAIAPAGTANVVNFNLNGAPWPGGSFVVTAAAHPNILVVLCTFTNPNGGSYEITLLGVGHSSTHYTVAQLHGEPGNAIAFTIDVV